MKKGFTLIEVLVASVLLGMLVTILTMVFNQSSIAWRTGRAVTAELDKSRHRLAFTARQADNLIVGANSANPNAVVEVKSAWDLNTGTLRTRSIMNLQGASLINVSQLAGNSARAWQTMDMGSSTSTDNQKSYIVGVRSLGPNKEDPGDDITTWPEEYSK